MVPSGNASGTLAWLFIGANKATYGHEVFGPSDTWLIELLSLENIPAQNTIYNSTGFSDLWPGGTPTANNPSTQVLAVNASYSNTASMLLCDPHMREETHVVSLVNQTFSIHEVVPSQGDSGGPMYALGTLLNPLLGYGSLKFSARRDIYNELNIPLSPVNWAAGQLTLQAMNFTADYNNSVGGVTFWDEPLPPEVIAENIGGYIQSAAKAYLVQGLLPIPNFNGSTIGVPATNASISLPVTILQTSAAQMFGTIALVVSILILAITLLFVGIGDIPLTVSTVEAVLRETDDPDTHG